MKKIAFVVLLLCIATIIYFFIIEQFKGVILSHLENTILSVTYLLVGVSLLVLFRLRNVQNDNEDQLKK